MLSFVGEDIPVAEIPSVAVVIANWNGAAHLPDCLDSIEHLDYPTDRLDVIVVDNGSSDSSLELLEQRYPWVRVLPQTENLGFAAASNVGAAAATSECVAFLNNDMRVDRRWLTELVASYDPEDGYACIASAILSWEGTHIDFVDGRINFHGAPDAEHQDKPLDEGLIEDGRDLPFACGGAMLISRGVFLDLGGFDPDYFAYCEDVDLGWRLWVTGHKVRLASRSRCFHRRHGTGSALPLQHRMVLYERNNLMSVIKNVSDENFAPLLTAALFLLLERSLILSGSDRAAYEVGSKEVGETELVGRSGMAGLHGMSDVLANLDSILTKRAEIQRRRKRSDAEVFDLFRRPFIPVLRNESYLQSSVELRAVLDLDRLFRRQRASRVLVVARSDSARLRQIARVAADLTEVVFASSNRAPTIPQVSVSPIRSEDYLLQLLLEADIAIVEGSTEHGKLIAERAPGLLVVDLAGQPESVDARLLERADVLVCASDEEHRRWADVLTTQHSNANDGLPRLSVVSDEGQALAAHLRSLVREPWNWQRRRAGTDELVMPEDLRLLLAKWRAGAGAQGRVRRRIPRAVWSRLPESLQRTLLHVLRPAARSN
jgi:GT2 family glycosyltransferase